MATFHPDLAPPDSPSSELKVRKALQALPPSWHVFHSVRWQASRAGRQGDGEADFVLLSPDAGLIVLEVKGGRIEVKDGQWLSVDRDDVRHSIKDPFRQATESKHALLRYLRDLAPPITIPYLCHAVVFPDVHVKDSIGLQPRAIVIDGVDLSDVANAVARVRRHWGPAEKAVPGKVIARIADLLSPTVTVSGRLRVGIAQAEQQILALTRRQIDVLAMLRTVRRCVVRGGAGTGKTLLAVAKAKRMAAEGARTLLVCFNAPLAARVADELALHAEIAVSTFHALCLRLGRSTGRSVPAHADEAWFAGSAANLMADAASSLTEGSKFDALLVDEAQDFTDDWITALQLLLTRPDESPVTLFLDNHQQVYRAALSPPSMWPVFELDLNCRNALPIAATVAGCFGDQRPTEGAEGPELSFVSADASLLLEHVQEVVLRLLVSEGLSPEQVVVLSNSREVAHRLRTMLVGPAAFVELGSHGVVSETIHRFKGLEAETVVLAMAGTPDKSRGDADRTLAYVGISRARSALFVVGSDKWIQWFKALAATCK